MPDLDDDVKALVAEELKKELPPPTVVKAEVVGDGGPLGQVVIRVTDSWGNIYQIGPFEGKKV